MRTDRDRRAWVRLGVPAGRPRVGLPTAGSNASHATKKVEFFEVRPPKIRISPVQHEAEALRE